MGDTHHQNYQPAASAAPSSKLGIKNAGGEIVEVQGGHIVRSTGRKDRHSKVCTAKGHRDRRMRLSPQTAIQFYDVQDRLGYDRPSKAVDWLIQKAKAAIDELEELPAWHPSTTTTTSHTTSSAHQEQLNEENAEDHHHHLHLHHQQPGTVVGDGGPIQLPTLQQHMENNRGDSSSFRRPTIDSDSISDTIRSFFPVGGTSVEPPSSTINFQNYPPDLLSRTNSQNQDLRLSLQSFQNPIMLQQLRHQSQHTHHQNEHHVLFSGNSQLGFDGSSAGWSEQQHSHQHPADISRFHRMIHWNDIGGADTGSSESGGGIGGGGFMFRAPPQQLQPLFGGQNQFLTHREPLQSSYTPYVRAWVDPQVTVASTDHHQYANPSAMFQSPVSGVGFAPGGYSGFHIPARIQGDEEEHDGNSNKTSSVSSDSRH